jgi:hypothetical protein
VFDYGERLRVTFDNEKVRIYDFSPRFGVRCVALPGAEKALLREWPAG